MNANLLQLYTRLQTLRTLVCVQERDRALAETLVIRGLAVIVAERRYQHHIALTVRRKDPK